MSPPAIIEHPSPNHNERRGEGGHPPVTDMLVIHYTGMMPCERALDWLCRTESKVSAHYLIDEDGTTWRMVPEDRRAWHAGVSAWRGWRDLNSRSIGIELSNPGHDYGYRDFPTAQIDALCALAGGILARHPIPARNVVAHSDIAPHRKIDPGERFPWPELAARGIGLWPEGPLPSAPGEGALPGLLAGIGYDMGLPGETVISAFQRRFRPACHDGVPDAETRAVAAAVHALVAADAPAA